MNTELPLKSEHILVVDDKMPIAQLISELIGDMGFDTRIATNSKDCLDAFRREMPSMVFLDIWLHDPAMDGLQILDHLKRTNPEVPVVIMSGHGTIEIAVQAMRRGAADFIEKPINASRLSNVVTNVMEVVRLKRQVRDLQDNQNSSSVLIGSSPSMQRARAQLDRQAGTNARVVLLGPSGSGRETAARYLHGISNRRNGPFIGTRFMNDSSDEIAALLFGIQHRIGNPEPGLIERANLGILYLDEVGDIPLEIQPRLARVIANQEVVRVGGDTSIAV
ncbi:MAG: response regulator, partial [Rhodobacteraceae bacterium]|nr:response regulator [Paracoccaceae bacterium]